MKKNHVLCSVCKEEKFVNPTALQKRIAIYGSIEEICKKWVCRVCKKALKPKKRIKKVAPAQRKRIMNRVRLIMRSREDNPKVPAPVPAPTPQQATSNECNDFYNDI